jgi:ABC-2 type transport system ATP-binding protein
VLLNSHLLSEVELVCDRVVILSRGSVVTQGRPEELTRGAGVDIETDAGTKRYDVARDGVPDLIAELVANGQRIHSVTPVRSTLEEVYLQAVEGEMG